MNTLLNIISPIIRKLKRIIGFVNKVLIYSAPFFLCVIAIIHGILYISGYRGEFLYQASDISGHSIFCVYFILIFTRRMCIWYKSSCWMLILYHVFNIICYKIIFMYGDKYIKPITLIYSMIIFSTISLLLWFISDSCRKTIKLIRQSYKRGQK